MTHTWKILALTLLLTLTAASQANARRATRNAVPHMYMFGFAASFNDTIIHITDIQEVDTAWVEPKHKLLLGREEYAYQMRTYLANQQGMERRTCVVFYNANRKKLEKEYARLTRLYYMPKDGQQHYDIRRISHDQFSFTSVDTQLDEAAPPADAPQPTAPGSDKKKKKQRKDRRR